MDQNRDEISLMAMLLGFVISICLYGIMIVQTLMYFNAFKTDPTWRKCLVAFLFTLDTASVVLVVTFIYQSIILQTYVKWLFICDIILTCIITMTVQLFFAWRIKILTSNKWFTSAIVICSLMAMSSGVATAIATARVHGFFEFQSWTDYQEFRTSIIPCLVFLIVTDIIITVTLVWHLKSSKTGFHATDDVIDRIIRVSVPTGVITTVFEGAYVISLLVSPGGLTLLFYFPLSKLYTNSVMSSLNSRGRWSHVGNKSNQQGSSQAGSTLQMIERKQVNTDETGGNDR